MLTPLTRAMTPDRAIAPISYQPFAFYTRQISSATTCEDGDGRIVQVRAFRGGRISKKETWMKWSIVSSMLVAANTSQARLPQTLFEAEQLIERIKRKDVSFELPSSSVIGFGISRGAVSRNMRILDSAVDAYTRARILNDRKAGHVGSFFCVSDGSPPSETRYVGLDLLITILSEVKLHPAEAWEDSAFDRTWPVLSRTRHLTDFCNSPTKTGDEIHTILQTQTASKGVSTSELSGMISDGGGEFEGFAGCHNLLKETSENGDYVDQRCMMHISWRVTDQGLIEVNKHKPSPQKISNFLRDGHNWTHLCTNLHLRRANNGCELCAMGSAAYYRFSSPRPPNVIDERPETDTFLLEWLVSNSRDTTLPKLLAAELCIRPNLKKYQPHELLASLKNWTHRVERRLDSAMLQKALWCYKYVKKHRFVLLSYTYPAFMQRAADIILDKRIDKHAAKSMGSSLDELSRTLELSVDQITENMSIVDVAITLTEAEPGDTDLNAGGADMEHAVQYFNEYHQRVTMRMASHLTLTLQNLISRPTWIAAGLVVPDAPVAQNAAREWQRHLLRVQQASPNRYELRWLGDSDLMSELGDFCDIVPPCLLWRNHGRYKQMAQLLLRSHAAEGDGTDIVEAIHARWKWAATIKRALCFQGLVATSKLAFYHTENGGLPPVGELMPFLESAAIERRAAYQAVVNGGAVPAGHRAGYAFLHRFNMSPIESRVFLRDKYANPAQGPDQFWETYIRLHVMQPMRLYNHAALSDHIFFVGSTKSLPGKMKPQDDEESSRSLPIAFFEIVEITLTGKRVKPIEFGDGILKLQLMTLAQISKACGYYPPVHAGTTAREEELAHERKFLSHELQVHRGNSFASAC